MNYTQAIAWLNETQGRGIKPGLGQIQRLLGELGFHGRGQRFIHVAGTNGKGSVCAMLDAVCRAQGIRNGLYTSPHLVCFRERIKLDGVMIGEQETAEGLDRIRQITEGWETGPTYFEIATALALDWFQRMEADVVALETGLGGRLDATNIVTPRVSVLTAIDLDHQDWLGSTLAEIASEKAGIIKPGVPVVSAPQHEEVAAVLLKFAAEKNTGVQFVTEAVDFPVGLAGSHQRFNAALALAALRAAGIDVQGKAIRSGLANVSWPGRFQLAGENCILDGAHNEAAAKRLALTWAETWAGERPAIILGVLKDKDIAGICRALLPIAAGFLVVPVRNHRSSEPEEVVEILRGLNPAVHCKTAPDLAHAVEFAKRIRHKVLVTGSLFLVGEALALFDPSSTLPEIGSQ